MARRREFLISLAIGVLGVAATLVIAIPEASGPGWREVVGLGVPLLTGLVAGFYSAARGVFAGYVGAWLAWFAWTLSPAQLSGENLFWGLLGIFAAAYLTVMVVAGFILGRIVSRRFGGHAR